MSESLAERAAAAAGVDQRRLRKLNQQAEGGATAAGAFVLYWMQRSQRGRHNPALEYAVAAANDRELPIVVMFALTDDYPEAQERHFQFMLEGLQDLSETLSRRGIPFLLKHGHPPDMALRLAEHADLLVCDRAYLRHLRAWRRQLAEAAPCPVHEVEGDVVVPVETASSKREFAARTIRRKITSRLKEFLSLPETVTPRVSLDRAKLPGEIRDRLFADTLDPADPTALCDSLRIRREVPRVSRFFRGGTSEGMRRARQLFREAFSRYADNRNQPGTDDSSHASMYLHFGQISPVWLALEARASAKEADDEKIAESADSFVEELVVRRELAHNYVFYEKNYDSYDALPPWALTTLREHEGDERPWLYSLGELEEAETHDEYWNAAMREMLATGYMHNYMRMYWGKKILEWSPSPREGFERALHLNNKYFLDGRDPNSYANVAWIFGLHDRPWQEREIFGKVRIMKASGLERKCNMPDYLEKVRRLSATEGARDDGAERQGELFDP